MVIRYQTHAFRPPHRVSCRLDKNPVEWLEGLYRDTTWIFEVSDPIPESFTLVLDGEVSSDPQSIDGPVVELDEAGVDFGGPSQVPVAIDDGRLQQVWFAKGRRDLDLWDVIVVGTGMGGGTLTAALTRKLYESGSRKLKVLALDAGSLLFPTHVANLPIRYGPNTGEGTAIWSSLREFGRQPYTVVADPAWATWNDDDHRVSWQDWEVFALGGRSLYWGGLCPEISKRELTKWPAAVADDLIEPRADGLSYYDRAALALSVGHPRDNDLEKEARDLLDDLLPHRKNELAPVAVRRERPTGWGLPSGLYSTADLLVRQRLRNGTNGSFGPPYVDLAEIVVALEPASGHWLVHTVDLRDGSRCVRRGMRVVLCAGTVETPRIVAASGLAGASGRVGKGLTEHPMAYLHFAVPMGSRLFRARAAADLVSMPRREHCEDPEFMLQFQLNADAVFDRGLPDGWLNPGTGVDPGHTAGQLVFFGRSDLGDGEVTFDTTHPWIPLDPGGGPFLPSATVRPSVGGMPASWQAVADTITTAIGALPLQGDARPLSLLQADPGVVSHEVGTMRMGADAAGAVVDSNLQVFGCEGLFVCDNSVFPTSPPANPSLTLAALALRLADDLSR
jgi:choline dehydrogenase-like flavoprotein